MSVVCDKGRGRPLGELKATFSTALKVLQCSKTIMIYDQSQCVLLALCVCALGRGLTEKVLGLGQRRGVPPPLRRGVGVPPPPLQPPKLSNTPWGHTLAGGGPPWSVATAGVLLFKGPQARRYTHKAVHTQGGAHKRRFVATAGVLLFKGPQARRYTQKAVHTKGGL